MARRPQKSMMDYMAILVSPVFIMLLVGSIVYFVLEVGYEGRWGTRLKWTMFWFVVGSVLIGRIAIERGSAMATFYALGLAVAVGLWTNKFLGTVPLVWCLLAFIWWFTHMMTKDCTLIDEDDDSSGEGLLQAGGLEDETPAPEAGPKTVDGLPARPPKAPPFWRRIIPNFSRDKTKPHSPGKWLVWFSLFALPAFGVGHSLIGDENTAAKTYGFQLLCVYVVAALCLLMTTSFLGLRRYLRQRFLRMPFTVTGLWLITGSLVALFILLVALLLPRPNATYDMAALIDQVSDQVQKASDKAFSEDGVDDDTKKNFKETQEDVKSDRGNEEKTTGGTKQGKEGSFGQNAKPGERDGQGNDNSAGDSKDKKADLAGPDSKSREQQKNQPKSKRGGDEFNPTERKGDQKSEEKKDPKLAEDGKMEQPDAKEGPKTPQWIGPAVKAAFWLVIGGTILFFLIRHRHAILAGLKKFWADIMKLFGRREKEAKEAAKTADNGPVRPAQPFRKFRNPFMTGMARKATPEELIAYSFRAMEAWAFEHDLPRKGDETPMEFGDWLGENAEHLSLSAPQVARIYSTVAYTREPAPEDTQEVIRELWLRMT
jgi:hypothetical protein